MSEDETRKEIDDLICFLFNIPSLEPLRELLAEEPVFNTSHKAIKSNKVTLKTWFE